MSSNTFLIDAASRHAILVTRYANGVDDGIEKEIRAALKKVGTIIEELYSPDITPARLRRLQEQIKELLQGEYRSIFDGLNEDLNDFIDQEIEFNQEMFNKSVDADINRPTLPSVLRSFNGNLMDVEVGNQIKPKEALSQYGKAKIKQINQKVKDVYTERKTQAQLQKEIRELIPLQARQAGSLSRTLINTASSVARFEHMFGNLDIFDGYEWVATLDSRTSLVCMGRDGRIFPFKQSSPIPPAHWGCRSTIVPSVKDEYNLIGEVKGERPAKGSEGRQIVSGLSTYGGWLRKQSAEFQNKVLGTERAKLFRNGKLSIDRFTNDKGQILTLKQLKKENPIAFERANLD